MAKSPAEVRSHVAMRDWANMAKKSGRCVICGAGPTVKAHLFPRALMLDMRDGSPQLVGGDVRRDGVRLQQNGEWDDGLLCADHEASIGAGDDYGIRFCRSYRTKGRSRPDGRALDAPNPKPDLLVHFAYATAWRHAASAASRADPPALGPFCAEMLEAMERRGPYALELVVGRNPLTIGGKRVDVAIAPYRQRMYQWNVWHFTISGLDFLLKTDRRPFPASWKPFLANGNDPLVVGLIGERGIDEVPKLMPLLRRMQRTTWRS